MLTIHEVRELPDRIPRGHIKKCMVEDTIDSFVAKGYRYAVVNDEDRLFDNGNNLRRLFQNVIDNENGYESVGVAIRGDNVYLFRKD